MTLPAGYFARMYERADDPWGFAQRWYEQRKYALTLAALPDPSYRAGLEVGCSVGVLTARLAQRCDRLLALDVSERALAAARTRVPSTVELRRAAVPDGWPAGTYDLVVLSEVLYYLDPADLERVLDLAERDLAPDGVVVACHWRHPVADYPQTGDAVHEAAGRRWPRLSRVEEADLLLDVLSPRTDSVAARTGLL